MTTDNYEDLKARLAALEADQVRAADLKAAEAGAMIPPAPVPTGLGREVAEAQDAQLAARRAAHDAWAARYEQQLAAAAPRLAELRGKAHEVQERRQAEDARHAAACLKLAGEAQRIVAQCAELEKPPPPPEVHYAAAIGRQLSEKMIARQFGAEVPVGVVPGVQRRRLGRLG